MKYAKPLLTACALLLYCTTAATKTLTDRLLAELLEKHMPARVYRQQNNPWPGGSYTLEVFKHGKPRITSGTKSIHVQMPLEIVIAGNVGSELLRFSMACNTSFTTLGVVNFTPKTAGSVSRLSSEITLPIPAVVADCGNTRVPVDAYLKRLVAQYKHQWEAEIDREVNAWLAQ